ncbi:peptidylprolyl isomerase [Pseudomonas sp. MYb118]|uniref:peptidylprolyl isomerase n=1 Tax=Pseudomonas sp. MYb118 TaxID=1848720 RepID=UPI0034CE31B9
MKITTLLMVLTLWLPGAFASNGPAVARVNDEEISALRFERYFAEYLEDQGRALGSIRNPKAYKQLRQKALDALIDRELLWQESQKRGVVISDADVSNQVEQMRTAMGGAEKFARRLEDAGFDEAGFAEYTRRELAAQQMFAELTKVAEPDEQAVRAFFDEHRSEMSQPETVQARHILVKVAQGADAATEEAARLRLVEMQGKIAQGADFASVARTGSEDASASEGGELGYFSRGRMYPAFEAAAFALKSGELSEPVRTPLGWHLIYLQNHLEAVDVSEAQGLEMVRAYLARQRQVQVRQQVLAQLRADNRIQRIDGD